MGHKARVWIVDDETEVTSSLVSGLQNTFDVLAFKNPAEVIALVRNGTQTPNAVMSDIRMPNIDGLQFLRELKKLKVNCPFILASGYTDKKEATEAINLGAFGIIDKPFLLKDIQTMLESAVSKDMREKLLLEKIVSQSHLSEAFQNLSNIYFDRLIMLQNQAKAIQHPLLTTFESRQEYLDSIKSEMVLLAQIQNIKSNVHRP